MTDDLFDTEEWAADEDGVIHVLPLNDVRKHKETRECWCGPRLERKCDECDGKGCFLCSDGMASAIPGEEQLVIHRAADGRE